MSSQDDHFGTKSIISKSTSYSEKCESSALTVIEDVGEQTKYKSIQNNEDNFDSDSDHIPHKIKFKNSKIINDSDSEAEINSVKGTNRNDHENLITLNEKRHKILVIVDSDSEEETNPVINSGIGTNENDHKNIITLNEKRHKRLAIVDSDSEEETVPVAAHNKSFSDDTQKNNEQPVFITNSGGKLIPENVNKDVSQAMRLSALCDPESSEDETGEEKKYEESNCLEETDIPKLYKWKRKSRENEKPKKMTGKKAAELRQEIKSESQRMLREKNISLPYHRPKSHTLKEFLSKRPKFSAALPTNVKVPPSLAIKMSTEQLTLVSKKLKEREKEVKEFYKSESESEDDHEDKDYVPPPESGSVNNEQNTKETNETTEILEIVSENNREEDCSQLASSENTIISGTEVPERKKLNSPINILSDINLRHYATAKEEQTSGVLGNTTVEQEPNQALDNENNANLTIIDNLNEEKSINKELDKEDSIHEELDSQDKSLKDAEEKNAFPETSTANDKKEQYSMDYEFNLDGLEDHEIFLENENPKDKSKFEYTDLDREIENFSCDDNQHSTAPTEQLKNLSKLELIKESIANIKPKLTGGPDDVIDLETGIAKPNEVTKLMKRFVEHNFKKPLQKNKVELSIISFESGEIHKETVALKVEDESEIMTAEEKPGAKLQKLRDELQSQMAQKRSELWQMKTTKQSKDEETSVDEEEKEDCGLEDDILDDEEEELEMSESSEEEEDEDEEAAECINREEKKKSLFIDEEAEESDEEGAIIEAASEEDSANDADEENEIDDLSEYDENEAGNQIINEPETQSRSKTFKKILKGFLEDSDEEELVSKPEDIKTNENTNMLSQDAIFPPHQPHSSQTPIRQITQKSDFEFLTPISYITGLQNLNNSASKNLKDSPVTSVFKNINEPSPLKEENWQRNLQKKLFLDTEITDSQAEELYSQQFPETEGDKESVLTNEEQIDDAHVEEFPCTSNANENEERLVDLCSGKFPTTAELIEKRLSDQIPSTQDLLNICSGEFTGITQNASTEKTENTAKTPADTYLLSENKEVKSLDEDQDLIISQLIDEEEMEKFKKRFESPLISNTQRRIVEEFEEAVAVGGMIDSDDDTDIVEVKKKNKKRIMVSDDEDSEDEHNEEEVIDLHDDIEDDENSNVAADDIAYDSEENEIELVDGGGGTKLKPSDFFENEAELSESEWGSADEDEKDLDTMEFEQGDSEKFDEKQMRTDLEKIHMRRLLDEDTRQVKLLQEMLLEDGELHGTGRERQFKWKNIDSVVETDKAKTEEDDVYLEEEESEEQWRKRRHEREMFLKEKLKKSQEKDDDDDDLLGESQLLKIGQKVLQRSSQNNINNDKNVVSSDSLVLKQSFMLSNKRGSFLSRSDQVLQRLAEYNKVSSTILGTATAKNSRNFLFQTVTVTETTAANKQDKKRKAADGTPNVIKRLRLSNNLSPAVKKKPSAKTKLFGGNW